MREMLDQLVPWLAEGAAPNASIIHYAAKRTFVSQGADLLCSLPLRLWR
jgi:hypothetical protein